MRNLIGYLPLFYHVRTLERHSEYVGHDLTRRTLLGILKYPIPYSAARCLTKLPEAESFAQVHQATWKPPKCYYDSEQDIVDWLLEDLEPHDRSIFMSDWETNPANAIQKSTHLEPKHGKSQHKSLDCSILELADDIAYATHDMEDGIAISLITREHWEEIWRLINKDWFERKKLHEKINYENITESLFSREGTDRSPNRRQAVNVLIGVFLDSAHINRLNKFTSSLLDLRAELEPEAEALLEKLKKLTYSRVVRSAEVQTLEFRGRMLVTQIFDALRSDPEALLKPTQLELYKKATSDQERLRVICDYVAGMTDPYANRFYDRLYVPRAGSTFDRL